VGLDALAFAVALLCCACSAAKPALRAKPAATATTDAASAPSAQAPVSSPEPPVVLSAAAKSVEFALLEDYDKGQRLDEVAKDFALFRQLGVRVWRGSFGWDDFEPEQGAYDFEWLGRFAALAADNGLTLRPYIGYTPAWAAAGRRYDDTLWNDPPRDIDEWRAFVRALVAAMQLYRNVASYEIYNEENVSMWWDGSAAEYNEVLAAASDEIRGLDPRAQVVLGGMVWPDESWLDAACKQSRNASVFDVVAFHAYPETWTKADVRVETYLDAAYRQQFLQSVRDCGGKPIWINETGFPSLPNQPGSEQEQARWWVRAVATFVSAPEITHIGIFELKDRRRDAEASDDSPNYHLGITNSDRTPKLAFATVRMLVSMLGTRPIEAIDDALAVRVVQGSAAPHVHAFRRADGTLLVFAWNDAGTATIEIGLPYVTGSGAARAFSYALDGSAKPYKHFSKATLREVELQPRDVRVFSIGAAAIALAPVAQPVPVPTMLELRPALLAEPSPSVAPSAAPASTVPASPLPGSQSSAPAAAPSSEAQAASPSAASSASVPASTAAPAPSATPGSSAAPTPPPSSGAKDSRASGRAPDWRPGDARLGRTKP
jgi:hypothetical protein